MRLEKAFQQASELIVELDEISDMAGIRRPAAEIYSFIEQTAAPLLRPETASGASGPKPVLKVSRGP